MCPSPLRADGSSACRKCSHWEARAWSRGPIYLPGSLGKMPTGVLLIKKRRMDSGEYLVVLSTRDVESGLVDLSVEAERPGKRPLK